jgi:hypothetical protein
LIIAACSIENRDQVSRFFFAVVPAKAGIHAEYKEIVMLRYRLRLLSMGPRLRGGDGLMHRHAQSLSERTQQITTPLEHTAHGKVQLRLHFGQRALRHLVRWLDNGSHQAYWQHREGLIDGFIKEYRVSRLVWYEIHADIMQAGLREKQIKKWNRA